MLAECNMLTPLVATDHMKFTYDLICNPQFNFRMTVNRGNIYVLKQLEKQLDDLY